MPAVQPSTERPTSCVADVWTPAMSSTSRSRTPVHLALPTRLPADLVADAGDRHVLLEHRQADQLVPGQGRLAVDQAVDPQRPGRGVDDRGQQRGVDPVEPVVRHDDRGQPGDRRRQVLRPASSGWHGHRRRRDRRPRHRPGRPAAARAGVGRRTRPRRPATVDAAGPDHERAARPVGHRAARRVAADDAASAPAPAQARAASRGPRARSPTEIAADDRRDRRGRPAGRRATARKPTTPNAAKPIGRDREAAAREDARGRPRWPARRDDEELERELVVGAEQGDDDVLGARRLEVDDDLADARRRASVAPGRSPASSSETPSAAAVAATPATASRHGAARVRGAVAWIGRRRAHGRIIAERVTVACRARRGQSASAEARPAPVRPSRRSTTIGSPNAWLEASLAQDVVERAGGHDPAVGEHERVVEPGRDLLDVVRDEHDRGRAVGRPQAGRGRASRVSRAPRSRLAAGSSSSRRSGSGISARAIETRRRSPADSVPYGWSARPPEPEVRRAAPGRAARSASS